MQIFDEDYIRMRTKYFEKEVDKGFAKIVNNLTHRGFYSRTVLEPKVRQLCAISGLTVRNALPQLKTHIAAAFRTGVTEAEVKEAIIQMATYCGMPYALQALEACKEVLQDLGDQDKR